MDLSRLYPSIIEAYNIAVATMKYKIKYTEFCNYQNIIGPVNKTDEFMEHYISNDDINYCCEYHNLPDISEMFALVGEKLSA